MATLIGVAFNYNEEKRLDRMFKAAAFTIGSYYPDTVFGNGTNMKFLKEQVFEMVEPTYKKLEEIARNEKRIQSKQGIEKIKAIDPTIDVDKLYRASLERIEFDLKARSRMVKEKLFLNNTDEKILKAANIGSAYAMEIANKKNNRYEAIKSVPLSRKLAVLTSIVIMPFVMIDTSKDIIRKVKDGYNTLLGQYHSLSEHTLSSLELVNSRSILHKDTDKVVKASARYSKGDDMNYFSKITQENKGITIKTNKPKDLNL